MTDTIQTRTFAVNIDCNSAAFDDAACGAEIARILRALANELEQETDAFTAFDAELRDINGNRCGDAEMFAETYSR
jgi:hypothetical protein